MDLLDLISGAGLTSVGLKNTSGSQAATPAPAVQATNPPKLILAAWLDEVVAGTVSWRGWRADGSLLANHNVDLPDFVPPTTPGLGKTTPGEGEARYVGFWMSDPEVDRWSSAEMTVLDADGKPLDDPATKENTVCAADRDENGKHAGWLLGIFYAGRMGKLPQQVMVRLRYSSGPWWNFGKEIPAEVSTPLVMDENVTVTKTGADARNQGKAFLEWNKPETPGNEQIDFQAVLKDGRTIGWLGISGNHFIFDATPDQSERIPMPPAWIPDGGCDRADAAGCGDEGDAANARETWRSRIRRPRLSLSLRHHPLYPSPAVTASGGEYPHGRRIYGGRQTGRQRLAENAAHGPRA